MDKKQNTPTRVIRIREVISRTGLSRTSIFLKCKNDPDFPKSVLLGEKAIGWLEHEVDGWLDLIAAKRNTTSSSEEEAA